MRAVCAIQGSGRVVVDIFGCAGCLRVFKNRFCFGIKLFRHLKRDMQRAFVSKPAWPAWFAVLRALCAVGEGAGVYSAGASTAAQCVAAVLGDALRRLTTLGGCKGMPRSLNSIFASRVVRFVGGLRCTARRIPTPGLCSLDNGLAVTRDGSTLMVSDTNGASQALHTFCVKTGAHLRTIGGVGDGPLQFRRPGQLWIAPDDFVFVADFGNDRLQILTPRGFDFHGFFGVEQLYRPLGVSGDNDHIVVVECFARHLVVFRRSDGALLRRFGCEGSSDGQLMWPSAVCVMNRSSQIAVADVWNHRVSVFSVDGKFVRTIGVGTLRAPFGVACSASGDEIVVADTSNNRVVVFSASGELLCTIEHEAITRARLRGVAMHGGALFAITSEFDNESKCVVFT